MEAVCFPLLLLCVVPNQGIMRLTRLTIEVSIVPLGLGQDSHAGVRGPFSYQRPAKH